MVKKREMVKRRGGQTGLCPFGAFLVGKLEGEGLRQDDLAAKLRIGKSSVTGIMNGTRGLKLEQFVIMADLLGVGSKELFKAMKIRPPAKD